MHPHTGREEEEEEENGPSVTQGYGRGFKTTFDFEVYMRFYGFITISLIIIKVRISESFLREKEVNLAFVSKKRAIAHVDPSAQGFFHCNSQ